MEAKTYSLGAKNPKRVITIQTTKTKFFLVFLVVMFLVVFAIDKSGLFTPDQHIMCNDGQKEEIEYNKFYYCGEHYTTIKGRVSDKTYNLMEATINGSTR